MKMYANGMRGIARVLGTPKCCVQVGRYGRGKYEELVELWGKAEEMVEGKVIAEVVDEMWTYP